MRGGRRVQSGEPGEDQIAFGKPSSMRRTMLAGRLFNRGGYDCEREIRTLELFKLRFGDASLHNCEARARREIGPEAKQPWP